MNNNQAGNLILDLCGGTGAWSKPYKDAGYDVRVITLPEQDVLTYIPPENVYGILAAPTCTMFSLARTTAKTPRDFHEGMALVEACLRIIWECRKSGSLKFWALENPMGLLRQFLGRPPHTFNPVDYGARHTKKTDLWGYYNVPTKRPVKLTEEELQRMSINNRVLPELPADYVLPSGFSRQAARRSMTAPEFAKAFMAANR